MTKLSNNDKYSVLIQGGEGPDVWDKEFLISAVDLADAVNQAVGRARDLYGFVAEVEGPGGKVVAQGDCLVNISRHE